MDHETAEEIKRHFNVVAEGLRADIRLVIEAVAANTERIDRIEKRLDKVEFRLDRVEVRLTAIETRLDRVEVRLTAVETRLGRVEVRLTAVETRLDQIEIKGQVN
jgi:septal ring factor EnvC (AmiA/AmiB activator)